MINTANLLLVTDSALLGSQRFVKIENIEGLPVASQNAPILRAEVTGTANGVSTLRLADGTQIKAEITPQLPIGSRLTLQPQPNQTANLLRYLPPLRKPDPQPASGVPQPHSNSSQPAPAQPSAPLPQLPDQTPLLQLAVKLPSALGTAPLPQVGTTLTLQVEAGKPTPGVGATVLGQIAGEPQDGYQTLELTNKTKLQIPVPPIFPPRAEVQLKILSPQTARIERLTTPVLSALSQAPQSSAPAHASAPAAPLPSPISTPLVPARASSAPIPAPAIATTTVTPLQTAIKTESPLPPALLQGATAENPRLIPVTLTTATDPSKTQATLPDGSRLTLNTPLPSTTEGHPMAMRIRADGLVDILPTTTTARTAGAGHESNQHQPAFTTSEPPPPKAAPQAGGTAPTTTTAQATVTSRVDVATYQLKFDNGLTINVHSERPLHIGAHLNVKITPDGHAEIIKVALPQAKNPKAAGLLNFALSWPNLNKAIHALAQDAPEALADLKNRLPSLDEAALPNIMRFAEAVSTRNLEILFGRDTLNILRALGLDGALSNDLSTLHTLHQKADQPDMWRGMVFPYWNEDDDHPRQGQFFWRHGQDESVKNGQEHTRFVVNFSLSQLGSLQLDGLVHEREMHMKLRTVEPLTKTDIDGLHQVMEKALAAANMHGGIEVEAVGHFDVDPVHDIVALQKNLDLTV